MRTIDWVDDAIVLIDQTRLPHDEVHVRIERVDDLVDAIKRLVVRGAPALGVAGAYGAALAARVHGVDAVDVFRAVRDARPTAVNLARMVDRVTALSSEGAARMLAEAHAIRDEEIAASRQMGERGADLVLELVGDRPVRIMTVCNTGGLATVERGTALAVAHTLHERGRLAEVLAVETRPLLQGARLTTWELRRMGAPHRLLVDAAGPFVLARGGADVVLAGADRIAANGDTANKIGTFSLALGAQFAGVPFVIVAPESTVDASTSTGADIEIEDRGSAEVVEVGGRLTAPRGTDALNPAFDVTPAALITAIVTDQRVIRP
jgi:methylthioribose-1-phosphate isomerase